MYLRAMCIAVAQAHHKLDEAAIYFCKHSANIVGNGIFSGEDPLKFTQSVVLRPHTHTEMYPF